MHSFPSFDGCIETQLTPRQLMKFKVEDGIAELIKQLILFTDNLHGRERQELLDLLYFTTSAANIDPFFSLELGSLGGFQALIKLNDRASKDDEDLIEVIENAIGSIVCSGCSSFPKINLDSIDQEYLRPLSYTFQAVDEMNPFGVILRRVPKNMFDGIVNVGFVLWSAALIQSRWLCRHGAKFLKGKDVLEIGAGVGLSGIVASHFACTSVVLTDFNSECLKNLRFNVALNQGNQQISGLEPATRSSCRVSVCKLDWTEVGVQQDPAMADTVEASLPAGTKFERIIGSDIICCLEDVTSVCNVIDAHLARTATARCFFVVATGDHRWGVETFVPQLQNRMDVNFRPLIHSSYDNGNYKGRDRHLNCVGSFDGADETTDLCGSEEERQQSDDDLLQGINEIDYYTWQIIHCRWKDCELL